MGGGHHNSESKRVVNMKVIGVLRVKDEADLLPSVLDNVSGGVDEIYACEDGSSDSTMDILKSHPKVTYIKPYDSSFITEVYKTRHLETVVKQRHPEYCTEEVWVALLAGDLYWLNQSPREAANRAAASGHDLRTGYAINFNLHHTDTWKDKDFWPNWKTPLREQCRWVKAAEELPVVWKVAEYTRWHRLPWPRHFKNRAVGIDREMPFLEHQGKRSPKHMQHKVLRGEDKASPPGTEYNQFKDLDWVEEWGRGRGYWCNPQAIPWFGHRTIDSLIELRKMSQGDKQIECAKWDKWYVMNNMQLPDREDLK